MAKMKFKSANELIDDVWGKVGTAERDAMEAQLKEEIQAYHAGEAIKKARMSKHLTQEQLGEMMGVKRAQVSRIEKGHNLTLSTISRAFKAMGIGVSLEIAGIGKVEL